MKYKVNRAVVIGAGTMGAGITALLVNAGVKVTLLDIVPRELTPKEEAKGLTLEDRVVRNRIVNAGLTAAINSRPASFLSKELANLVTVGNLEDDFDLIAEADWVIEAIVENLKIKQGLMERIDKIRSESAIVSTNTSGIPVGQIAEGRSEGFRQHFLGTHFFNPPRYMKLLEIIPTGDTLPDVVDFISHYGEYRLGKGIVMCKDTPNFIGNRLGSVIGSAAINYILEKGYTIPEVDTITGPLIGRPKTATFRLMDLVGIDVSEHVRGNLAPAIPHDEIAQKVLSAEGTNKLSAAMIERGWLGNKTKIGYYKTIRVEGKKQFWPLNLETMEHEEPVKVRFDSVGEARKLETLPERMKVMLEAEDRAGQLVQALTLFNLYYASHVIPEIADTPKPLDDAMRWGFMNEAGPFEGWDGLGVASMVEKMKAAGHPPAEWVDEMLASGKETFYQYEDDRKVGVYNAAKGDYEPIERTPGLIFLGEQKSAGNVLSQNTSATLIDLGDGVACVEFHTKMNAIDEDLGAMILEGMDRAEAGEFEGLVIGNEAANFSAGANLFGMVMSAQQDEWEQIELGIKGFQGLNMRIRYCTKPVVVAPAGMALGGGAEITMHAGRVVASSELYIGLVELGAGLIPGGGGVKEMLRRVLNPPMRTKNADAFPFLQRIFEQVGQAKVATSAVEAREMGILDADDRIILNREHLLAEAKREVLHLAESGYRPPDPEKIYAGGRDMLSALRVGLHMFKEGKYISEHDSVVAGKLIYILTGGDLSRATWVDEQYILDLEREAFLSLLGEEKTRERMWHLLQTGKPLRN